MRLTLGCVGRSIRSQALTRCVPSRILLPLPMYSPLAQFLRNTIAARQTLSNSLWSYSAVLTHGGKLCLTFPTTTINDKEVCAQS